MDAEKIKRDALVYLKEKYHEDFDILGVIGNSRGTAADRIGAKPKHAGLSRGFTVFSNGEHVFSDTYSRSQRIDLYRNVLSGLDITNTANPRMAALGAHAVVEIVDATPDLLAAAAAAFASARLAACVYTPGLQKLYCSSKVSGNYKVLTISDRTGGGSYSTEVFPQLNNGQLERLCGAVYLEELPVCLGMGNLGIIARYMLAMGFAEEQLPPGGENNCDMTADEWRLVLTDIANSPALSALAIADYIDITELSSVRAHVLPGHRAVCFLDKSKNAYIVFRGTSGDYEWYDNGEGMIYSDTTQQLAAADFVNKMRGNPKIDARTYTIAGHSKGGNKAMYAFLTTDGTAYDRCFSLDGQGFSSAFFQKYAEQIDTKQARIVSYAERRDFVNCLGFYIKVPRFFTGRRGEHTESLPYGQPLPFFHCPDALRTSDNGEIGPPAPTGYISAVINDLIVHVLSDEKHAGDRLDIALNLCELMMQSKTVDEKEIVSALAKLILIFIEMVAENANFDTEIANVLINESDVVMATAGMAFLSGKEDNQNQKETSDFGKKLFRKMTADILLNPEHIRNVLIFAEKLASFATRVRVPDDIGTLLTRLSKSLRLISK